MPNTTCKISFAIALAALLAGPTLCAAEVRRGDVPFQFLAGETVLRAKISARVQPGVVYTTFHFPESGTNVITTESSDWATNCLEFKVTAVQVKPVTEPSGWQQKHAKFSEAQHALLNQGKQEW